MAIQSERGYIIPAVNTSTVDYVSCAIALAESIKQWHPTAKVCLMTDQVIEHPAFDYVKRLPFGDKSQNGDWKLSNDWQVFYASPFRQTIKLEADMLATSPIDHWWSLFEKRLLVISQGCRNFYDEISDCRYYRKVFDVNDLPDVYNAITYWQVSLEAKEFFDLVRQIFENWDSFQTLLKFPDSQPTTDVVYAIAAHIIGVDQCTLPKGYGPTMVHMKQRINPISGPDWTKFLIWEDTEPGLRINTVAQHGFVHYHNKEWINESRNNR